MQPAGSGGQIGKRSQGAIGGGEFLDLIFSVAPIFGVERGEVIFVTAPGWIDFKHHIRLGVERLIAESAQGIEAGFTRSKVLDHNEIRLAMETLGPPNAIERFRHAGPKLRWTFPTHERNSMKAPTEQVAGDEYPFGQSGASPARRRRDRSQNKVPSPFLAGVAGTPAQ